jgi:putative ABC transport system permease protein
MNLATAACVYPGRPVGMTYRARTRLSNEHGTERETEDESGPWPMPLIEIMKQTLAALWANKLRSFLTMFGIVWGITSVILLVGLGIGFNADQKERMQGLGTDIAIVWGGKTGAPYGGYAAGRQIDLNLQDAYAIRDHCLLIKSVSPELSHSVAEVSAYNAANAAVHGVWPEYQQFRNIKVDSGRLMTQRDEDTSARVVVMGAKIRDQLFPGQPSVGQTLQIGGMPYTVIGIIAQKKQNSSYGGRDQDMLFVPFSSMAKDFPPSTQATTTDPSATGVERGWINNLVAQPASPDVHEAAVKEIYETLGERHHFNADDKEALFVWDTLKGAELTARIFGVMTWFFGVVALLTLCLGGIGVMNIMLVAVTERTREIGIRKALGARARDIQLQFFAESVVITLLSGSVGLALGITICVLAKYVPLPDFVPHPVVSPIAVIASLFTLALITLTAGTYPARKARDLSPMECLRTD